MQQSVGLRTNALHVFVLTSFAVAQPVYDRLAHNGVLLEDLDIGLAPLLLVIVAVSVLVPASIVLVEALVEQVRRNARERWHQGVILLAGTAIVLPLVGRLAFLPGLVSVAIAIATGLVAAYAYPRFAPLRWLLTAASPAIVVFPAALLFYSPASDALFGPRIPVVARATVSHPTPVFLLVFDEFCGTSLIGADREINALRYPHFAEFAEHASWFRNATSVHWRTLSAVPAILTGKYPGSSGQGTLTEHPVNLFTILRSSDAYDLVVFEPVTRLCPTGNRRVDLKDTLEDCRSLLAILSVVYLHSLAPNDLKPFLPDMPQQWFGVRDPSAASVGRTTGVLRYGWNRDRDRQFQHYLDCIRVRKRPTLYFEHVVLPHFPWCYLPSGDRYAWDNGSQLQPVGAKGVHSEIWDSDPLAVQQSYQQYLLQLGYCDTLLGNLLARVRDAKLYDSSLIIVMADHGVCFQPGESRRAPTQQTLNELMPIPLLVKEPGQQDRRVSDRNVELIDILPTILDVLGITPRVATDGSSLLNATEPERSLKFFHGETERFSVDNRFQAKYRTVGTMRESLGDSWSSLYKIGPFGSLVGRSIAEFAVGEPAALSTELNPSEFVLGPSHLAPCFVQGRLVGAAENELPVHLAIAVNGTIEGTTRTYLVSDVRDTWAAMLPEDCFHKGENRVDLFVIAEAGNRLVLHPCGVVK